MWNDNDCGGVIDSRPEAIMLQILPIMLDPIMP